MNYRQVQARPRLAAILGGVIVLSVVSVFGAEPPAAADWRTEPTSGEIPSARGAGKLVAIGNRLVMFGGFRECFDQRACEHEYYDDFFTLDLTTMKWERKNPTAPGGERPSGRAFFGGATYSRKGTMIIFGGTEYNATTTRYRVFDDMWEYDPAANRVTRRAYKNSGPGGRLGAEIAIKDDTLYLFGGYDGNQKGHNDLWSYDLNTDTWRRLIGDDDPGSPSKRYIFRFEMDERNGWIYVFGGNYREEFTIQRNDTWRYDISKGRFEVLLSEDTTNITGRTHGAAAVHGDRFFVALGDIPSGGCFTDQASEHQNPTDEVWSLRVTGSGAGGKYERVAIRQGFGPLKRLYYAVAGGRLYVTHGFDFKCEGKDSDGAIYSLKTFSLALSEAR